MTNLRKMNRAGTTNNDTTRKKWADIEEINRASEEFERNVSVEAYIDFLIKLVLIISRWN